jgi:uncharacterized protein YecT (DUF1311 family)
MTSETLDTSIQVERVNSVPDSVLSLTSVMFGISTGMRLSRVAGAKTLKLASLMRRPELCVLAVGWLLPTLAYAASPCRDLPTEADMNNCIVQQVGQAEKELVRYLAQARRSIAADPKSVAALDQAQEAWSRFRSAHCDAVYQNWSNGTVRHFMRGSCLLQQTQRRTHDLWQVYLTYVDSTPPVLPEPQM